MHSIEKLQTKQVGLKLPLYLLEDLEEITNEYDINRSTIITEAVRIYLAEYQQQKTQTPQFPEIDFDNLQDFDL